jgi:ABC-2 type transport system ATP-binding protein
MLTDNPAVEAKNISKKFGSTIALNGLSLKVEAGQIYGLVGPNGSGKSTIVKILCGLLEPDEGEAFINGNRIPNRKISEVIGYMPQELSLYQNLTVHQNLRFFGELYGLSGQEFDSQEKMVLEVVDLLDRKNFVVNKLSSGLKRRASLACTLLHEPKVAFLDEPTVGVDPELRVNFWEHFKRLQSNGVTLVLTTHYMDEANKCDQVGFMHEGKLIADGAPNGLLAQTNTESLEDAFLKFLRKGENG